jgi:chromosome segregation ATPase
MNEEKKREDILAAETAIRELAQRMAEASICTKQADMARNTLESTIRSLEEVNVELRALIESEKKAAETERISFDQACESLDANVKKLQKSQESLEKEADHLGASLGERTQELQRMIESKLLQEIEDALERFAKRIAQFEVALEVQGQNLRKSMDTRAYDLSGEVNEIHEELSAKSKHLETFICETNQESRESADNKLNDLLKNMDAISNKLLFVMDQNEASTRRVQAVEQSIKGLSVGLQDIGNRIQSNSEEREELKMGIAQFNERLLSLEQVTVAKTSGISNRLRSAFAGGLGIIMVVMMLKFV